MFSPKGGSPRSQKKEKKKLTIKLKSPVQKLPAAYEDSAWKTLKDAVDAIYGDYPITTSLQDLYQLVENLCHHKCAAKLYDRLEEVCKAHVLKALPKLNDAVDDVSLLCLVGQVWTSHMQKSMLIRQIFVYLDRTYVMQTSSLPSLEDMSAGHFCSVICDPQVATRHTAALLMQVQKERGGESVERNLMSLLLRMLDTLGVYEVRFEAPFLKATTKFYTMEANNIIQDNSVSDYLIHVEHRLEEEKLRVEHYLKKSTRKPLIALLDLYCLEAHIDTLLTSGFSSLLDERRHEDLKRLYALLGRVTGALTRMRRAMQAYIKEKGKEVIQAAGGSSKTAAAKMIPALLDLRKRMSTVVSADFSSDQRFQQAVKDGFQSFMNERQGGKGSLEPAEWLAKFVDGKLRATGQKGVTEEELEETLDSAMVLFRHVDDKDVFEALYKRDLSKRLLLQKTTSFDAEKSMILKLREECGGAFTSKLEGMFKDMELSTEHGIAFADKYDASALHGISMSVSILTAGTWPAYKSTEAILPVQLASAQRKFEDFYLSQHSGRKLSWMHSWGQCVIRTNFPKAPRELSVSLPQAIVLLQFSDTDTLTYTDIAQATNLDSKELVRTLASLACGKSSTRVLLKTPKGKEINEDDVFDFNLDFTHKLFRIKISQIQMKETSEEKQRTRARIVADRQYEVDAAIVRTLKARKNIHHVALKEAVQKQLRFPVEEEFYRKRLILLREREYLKPGDEDHYIYMA